MTDWRQEAIRRGHDRARFDCGVPALNDYLRFYARQNHESGGSKTFVAVKPSAPKIVVGYYTIGATSIDFSRVPSGLLKGLGRYAVPAFLLARLAVELSEQGRGLGAWLLFAAGDRAIVAAGEVGGIGLAIDAKDSGSSRWYQRFGAISLLDDPLRLILPFGVLADARRSTLKSLQNNRGQI